MILVQAAVSTHSNPVDPTGLPEAFTFPVSLGPSIPEPLAVSGALLEDKNQEQVTLTAISRSFHRVFWVAKEGRKRFYKAPS